MRKLYTLLFLSIAFSPINIFAQQQRINALQLAGRQASLSQNIIDLATKASDAVSNKGLGQFYIKFSSAPDKKTLLTQGIVLENTVQANIYTASISKAVTAAVLQSDAITGWAVVNADDKINPLLKDKNSSASQPIALLVSCVKSASKEDVQNILHLTKAQLQPDQQWKDQHIWQINVTADKIAEIAQNPIVLSITPDIKPVKLDREIIGLTNSEGALAPLSIGGHNLHGDGVSIGIGDNVDPVHIDFIDRVTSFNQNAGDTHGIHTAGMIAGNGIVDERYKGTSNKCNLVADYFSSVITHSPTYLQDFDMVLSNNSYANIVNNCGYAGTYDIYSQYTDQQLIDHPTLMHMFASGNDGANTCSPFPTTFATTVGSFSSAKNELTVGSVPKRYQWIPLHVFTAKGPVKDGRIKPEIAAVGERVISTLSNNGYDYNSGTSMACPNVTGGAGLLVQRYRQLHSNQDPEGALIKNILMNGATDIANPGPDYSYGFGTMNIGHSLTLLDSNRIFSNSINTGIEQTFTFTIPANIAKAKVMLSWNDPAAAPLSTVALINDLDLTVTNPANVTTLPLILNPDAAHVNDNAVAGADHTNNVEQVTLNNPTAGAYTIKIKGFNVPEIDQKYYVSYDFIPVGVTLQYPFGGEAVPSNDSIMVYWEASDDANTFTLSYSTDNGTNWSVIDNNLPANLRDYQWLPPNTINSNQCMVKISRNNTTQASQSKSFTIIGRPVITMNPNSEQCPGNIKISWTPITGAANYHLFKKMGLDMVDVATITGTTYTFTGLSSDTTYWVAVAPSINGSIGMRSIALSRRPNDGQCTGIGNHGDLRMAQIVTPGSGRMFTSTALSANQPILVSINNQDDQAAFNYRVSYKINAGAWIANTFTNAIPAAGSIQLNIGNANFSAAGTYAITVAVTNLAIADPVSANDTVQVIVKQIDNPVMDLVGGYNDGFESNTDINIIGNTVVGLDSNTKWDFAAGKSPGRLKNFLNSGITISGNKSMSMDDNGNQYANIANSSYNTLTGTFNLSNFTGPNDEIRGDFDYVMSGVPKFDTGNGVWLRGSDTDPWIHLLDYQRDSINGSIFNSGSLQLSDKLNAAGQTFTSSAQIRFTQYDTSRIETTNYGNGVTIDNFKLYSVKDDVGLLSIDSVFHYNCGLSAQVPLKIKVINGVNNTIHNITLSYRIDSGGNVITETLDSIPGNDTLEYTFNQKMDLSSAATYKISTWVYAATDNYRLNDSIIDFEVKNQPVITTFPYLENFENGEDYYYSEGAKNSWEYGTPASPMISHAASGLKAWKTNLAGNYNSNELSFLYSPCFDISQLAHPTLSFNMAVDVEEPGTTIYDQAYVEYTHDGVTWQRLGAQGQGFNWYNNDSAEAWTIRNLTYWHVATIPLPNDAPIVSIRFVLRSDPGTEYEGFAIDDIHVYDLVNPIFDQSQFASPISQSINANQKADFIESSHIGASVISGTTALGNTKVQDYKHDQFINKDSTQYFVPKNFTVNPANASGDSATVRFYIPESAIAILRNDTICGSCSKVREPQSLGITKYDDQDKSVENNTLADNINGDYVFIPKNRIVWIPYDVGYYAETKVKTFSEFWFNDGGPTHDKTLQTNIFNFTAAHLGDRYALLNWSSAIDSVTIKYEIQRSQDSNTYNTFATVNAAGQNNPTYSLSDTPLLGGRPAIFYRIKYTLLDSSIHYSVIRSLDWTIGGGIVAVYPNPSSDLVNLNWFKGTGDNLQWAIYNSVGQRVITGVIDKNTYNGTHQFNFAQMGVTHGVYILQVLSGKQEWKFKVVFD
jgi:hypothetical protein